MAKRILALIAAIAVLILFLVIFIIPPWTRETDNAQEIYPIMQGLSIDAMILWESDWNFDGQPIFYGTSDLVSGHFVLAHHDFFVVDINVNPIYLADIPHETRVEIFFTGDIDDSYPAAVDGPILLRVKG
ncbi:MAG: hypothetical protein FWC76_05845 [Defluviitaleaceae bacterium]|nr:hypothetical protein [Defluviitaleaceae bacterium]